MKIFIVIVFLFIVIQVESQVGINNPIPDSTSVLDLKSTTKGFLIPRMTTTQRNSINLDFHSSALMVYDTDIKKFMIWGAGNYQWAILNPWYSEDDGIIHYGATNQGFKVNFAPSGGSDIFKVASTFNGLAGDAAAFQSEFVFDDYLLSTSGIRFNTKISGLNFKIMQAFYNGNAVMTIKDNGNMGLGYTNPSKKLEVNGEIDVSGNITAGSYNGKGIAPIGSIVMWSGSTSSIPSGWQICNGANNTPDLRGRFVVGAGSNYSIGNTGGANSVAITTSQMPSHNHGGTTNSAGAHTHKVVRDAGDDGGNKSVARISSAGIYEEYDLSGHSNTANYGETDTRGQHRHSFTTDNTGSGQGHENRPAYYALAFIMRLH